jgi:hypothetical protein
MRRDGAQWCDNGSGVLQVRVQIIFAEWKAFSALPDAATGNRLQFYAFLLFPGML